MIYDHGTCMYYAHSTCISMIIVHVSCHIGLKFGMLVQSIYFEGFLYIGGPSGSATSLAFPGGFASQTSSPLISPSMILKWLVNDPWIISKWFLNHPYTIRKWCDVQIMSKWCPNGTSMIPKWFLNYTQMIPKRYPNDTQMMSKWCPNNVQIMSEWCPNDV